MPKPAIPSTPVGSVFAFAGNTDSTGTPGHPTTPIEASGWMVCNGRALSVAQYPELFSVLGYRYGGHAETFRIPNIPSNDACPQLSYIIHFANPDLLMDSIS